VPFCYFSLEFAILLSSKRCKGNQKGEICKEIPPFCLSKNTNNYHFVNFTPFPAGILLSITAEMAPDSLHFVNLHKHLPIGLYFFIEG